MCIQLQEHLLLIYKSPRTCIYIAVELMLASTFIYGHDVSLTHLPSFEWLAF